MLEAIKDKITRKMSIKVSTQETSRDGPEFRTWFRGEHTNFNPKRAHMLGFDALDRFVLKGWAPDAPLITPDTQITAFGSCFARNISDWLSQRNFRVLNAGEDAKRAYVVTMGEGMVNSFVIRQQFEWAWENKRFEQALWHGYKAEEYGYDEEVRLETKRIFDDTEVFILTFGLSEVWYDEPTGNVFWRTIPKEVYDPERHKFRVSSVEENAANIRAIYDLIGKHRPNAKLIVSLSPIPLIATFRDVSCLTANSVSKATLRVAIDQVIREVEEEGKMFYWPSYEMITDVFHLPYKPDRRHIPDEVLDHVMRLFERTWCTDPSVTEREFIESWVEANLAAGNLPASLRPVMERHRPYALLRYIRGTRIHEDDAMDGAAKEVLDRLRLLWREELNAAEADADDALEDAPAG